jgi:hypothetical protein
MIVITNMTKARLVLGTSVVLEPAEQLDVQVLSEAMITARDAGALRVLSGDETAEERKADVDAFKGTQDEIDKLIGKD